MTKADQEQIRLIIQDEIRPVRDMVIKHQEVLFGPSGEKGIMKDVEDMKTLTYKIIGGFTALSFAVQVILKVFWK